MGAKFTHPARRVNDSHCVTARTLYLWMSVSTSVGFGDLGSYGNELPSGNINLPESANRDLIPWSRQICLTEIRVYLNSGTYRTLVKTNRNIFPVESFARIGMSPIAVHLHMLPLAALKSSSQGRTLTSRARVSVHEAVQPESIGARKIGKELDLIWL